MRKCLAMQAALSECSSLRHLALCAWVDPQEKLSWKKHGYCSERRNVDWPMVLEFSEELPRLVVLELQLEGYESLPMPDSGSAQTAAKQETADSPSSEKRARLHFYQELIRSIVQSDAAGLQLLRIKCGIGREQADSVDSPPTLRYLSSSCRSDSYNSSHCMHFHQPIAVHIERLKQIGLIGETSEPLHPVREGSLSPSMGAFNLQGPSPMGLHGKNTVPCPPALAGQLSTVYCNISCCSAVLHLTLRAMGQCPAHRRKQSSICSLQK